MNSLAQHIDHYKFTDSDRLFLDTNIWIYMFGQSSEALDRLRYRYSTALSRAIEAKSQLFTDVLVVSEFINTYARKECEYLSTAKNFKEFRRSKEFKSIAKEIAYAAGKITEYATLLESGFSDLQIDDVLADYAKGEFDFNLFLMFCRIPIPRSTRVKFKRFLVGKYCPQLKTPNSVFE